MELPKNVTQVGEFGGDSRVYMEDYVVSYIKELNRAAQEKDIAVSLYGRWAEEQGRNYYFVYGACKLDYLQREVRHLSQAQYQEIEKLRKKYFPDYTFLGYRLLNGEIIEGVHICNQEICRYVSGYARFYEKNDAMLAYMLEVREEASPEQIDSEKYEEVKQRQAERRTNLVETTMASEMSKIQNNLHLHRMRFATVLAFAVLCVVGAVSLHQKLPIQIEGVGAQPASASEVLAMEEKLEEALLRENESMETSSRQEAVTSIIEETQIEETQIEETNVEKAQIEETQEASTEATPAKTEQETLAPVAYVVQQGDTLIAISTRQYGTDAKVSEICRMNKIKDPDDIKQGQIIVLP